MWDHMNRDWIEIQHQKRIQEEKMPIKEIKKKRRKQSDQPEATSAMEALKNSTKLSSRINHEALAKLLNKKEDT